ncbi:deoxyribose-phosphate aldolase [soil metagenome]
MAKSSSAEQGLNKIIEHTLLKQDATTEDVKTLCEEAKTHKFFGVCVPPYYVEQAHKLLEKTSVKVITVVGFPLGYSLTSIKVEEAKKAIEKGADEIDMVINLSAFRNKEYNYIKNEIDSVATIARMNNKLMKVIIESGSLTDEEIVKACELAVEGGADFVKTSTGFNGTGAKVEHVALMRASLPEKIKIKASGGIKDRAFALELAKVGADRIGASASINLMEA